MAQPHFDSSDLDEFDPRVKELLQLLSTGSPYEQVARCAEAILDQYVDGDGGNPLFVAPWRTRWKLSRQDYDADEGCSENFGWYLRQSFRDWFNAEGLDVSGKNAFCALTADMAQYVLNSKTVHRNNQNRSRLEASLHDYLDLRGYDSVPSEDKGVTLFDVAYLVEEDELAAKECVKRWVDSKKITASPIGKCPLDGRKTLYKLSEILVDVKRILTLEPQEISKYRQTLTTKLRSPRT